LLIAKPGEHGSAIGDQSQESAKRAALDALIWAKEHLVD
jgi:hypothetical protein